MNADPMTEQQLEAMMDDAELVGKMLSHGGPRHMLGALALAMAVGLRAAGYNREKALGISDRLISGSYDAVAELSPAH